MLPSEDAVGFRMDSLELQHPHFILEYSDFGVCEDITFDELGILGETFTEGINTEIKVNVDDLELNLVQILDPIGMSEGDEGDALVFDSECTDETSCEPAVNGELAKADFTVSESGTCLTDIPGIFAGEWPDGRTSNPNTPSAGDVACYVSDNTPMMLTLELESGSLELPLQDVQIAARFDDDHATAIHDGVIIGFLTEADADDADVNIGDVNFNVGEDLLPADGPGDGVACHGRTHCDGPDARVTHNGVCGWWFALNFNALRLADVSEYED